jgi:Domain of unknown function (DUF1905)/Bacteriocin-protection, YdeI or OmpD-Associated
MQSGRLCFSAELESQRRGWLGVHLPPGSAAALGTRGQIRIRATIRGASFDTVALPDGSGGHFLPVKAQLRRRLALLEGARVDVAIETAPLRPHTPLPHELRTRLSQSSEARLAWEGLTDAARQMACRWIGSAKSEDVRSFRANDVVRRALRHHSGAGPFYPTEDDQKLLSRPHARTSI